MYDFIYLFSRYLSYFASLEIVFTLLLVSLLISTFSYVFQSGGEFQKVAMGRGGLVRVRLGPPSSKTADFREAKGTLLRL